MTDYFSILTTSGVAKLAAAQAQGIPVAIKHVAVGDGGGASYVAEASQMALVNEVWQGRAGQVYVDPGNATNLVIESIIPKETGGWSVREIGIFDDSGTMIAVCGDYPETYKETLGNGSAEDLCIRTVVDTSAVLGGSLEIDPAMITASRKYVDQKLAAHVNDPDPHPQYTVPSATTEVEGKVELATIAEAGAGVDETRAVTPAGLGAAIDQAVTGHTSDPDPHPQYNVPSATTEVEGKVELATLEEARTGEDDARAVTPAGLAAALNAMDLRDETMRLQLDLAMAVNLDPDNMIDGRFWAFDDEGDVASFSNMTISEDGLEAISSVSEAITEKSTLYAQRILMVNGDTVIANVCLPNNEGYIRRYDRQSDGSWAQVWTSAQARTGYGNTCVLGGNKTITADDASSASYQVYLAAHAWDDTGLIHDRPQSLYCGQYNYVRSFLPLDDTHFLVSMYTAAGSGASISASSTALCTYTGTADISVNAQFANPQSYWSPRWFRTSSPTNVVAFSDTAGTAHLVSVDVTNGTIAHSQEIILWSGDRTTMIALPVNVDTWWLYDKMTNAWVVVGYDSGTISVVDGGTWTPPVDYADAVNGVTADWSVPRADSEGGVSPSVPTFGGGYQLAANRYLVPFCHLENLAEPKKAGWLDMEIDPDTYSVSIHGIENEIELTVDTLGDDVTQIARFPRVVDNNGRREFFYTHVGRDGSSVYRGALMRSYAIPSGEATVTSKAWTYPQTPGVVRVYMMVKPVEGVNPAADIACFISRDGGTTMDTAAFSLRRTFADRELWTMDVDLSGQPIGVDGLWTLEMGGTPVILALGLSWTYA